MALDWDILNEDCADITDWTDGDSGGGETTQVTFDSKSCFKMAIPASPAGDAYAFRYRALTIPDTFTCEYALYMEDVNGYGSQIEFHTTSGHMYMFIIYNHAVACYTSTTNPVLYNAFCIPCVVASPPPTGDEVTTFMDRWQTIRIVVKASRKVDVWVNNKCYIADLACSVTTTAPYYNQIYVYNYSTASEEATTTYYDWIKIDTTPEGQSTSSPVVIAGQPMRVQLAHNANWEYTAGGDHAFAPVPKYRVWNKDVNGNAYQCGIPYVATDNTNASKTRVWDGSAVKSLSKLPT